MSFENLDVVYENNIPEYHHTFMNKSKEYMVTIKIFFKRRTINFDYDTRRLLIYKKLDNSSNKNIDKIIDVDLTDNQIIEIIELSYISDIKKIITGVNINLSNKEFKELKKACKCIEI